MLGQIEGFALFALYAVFIITIVYFTRCQNESRDDFLLMKRDMGTFKGAMSLAVSWMWAPAIFICSLQAFTQGLPGIFWFTLPNILAFFIFIPSALQMRKVMPKGYTISQVFKYRFPDDSKPHKASTLVTFGYQIGAIIINCVAGATLISLLANIPYSTGVLMMGIVSLAYSLISGFRASVISDVIQMGLVLVIAFILVPMVVHQSGGWDIINIGLGGVSGEYRNMFDPGVAFAFGIATSIGLISGPMADQMFSQRVLAAKEKSIIPVIAWGGILFGFVPIILSLLGFIGAGTAISDPSFQVTDPQMVGPEVIAYYLPEWALMLFAIMAFAGLTSTLDSAFCAIGSLWVVDVKNAHEHKKSKKTVYTARLGMIIFAIIGIGIALLQPKLLWIFLIYGALAGCLFFPVLFSLFDKSVKALPVFIAIVAGFFIGTPMAIYANVIGQTELIVLSAISGLCIPALVILGSKALKVFSS